MPNLRTPEVAGLFYPNQAAQLETEVDEMLSAVTPPAHAHCPKVLIVPHAGYVYSGPVAAQAYALLHPWREQITRVVLLGPAHRLGLHGLASSRADAFVTPLGQIPVDQQALAELAELPQVVTLDQAHMQEHSLEVQLPFLQRSLSDFSLVPLVVGDASSDEVAEVLERLWGGEETLVVISTDLSHYHSYPVAQRMDLATTRTIEQLDGEALGYEDACGRNPLRGLLAVAKRRHMQVQTLDLRNSGDTAGPRDRVVGYGAYAVYE